MKQLVDCVGMSARKKVLESGRKPRLLTLPLRSSGVKKDVRFGPPPVIGPGDSSEGSQEAMMEAVDSLDGWDHSESEGPPSPSPRPGSAMSILSRRSVTPTISASYSQRLGTVTTGSNNTLLLNPPTVTHRKDHEGSSHGAGQRSDQAFTIGALDVLEHKQASVMKDIEDIERRMEYLVTKVGG